MVSKLKFGFITTEGGHYYEEALREAILGEELGFASVWLEEHHGVKDHYWPSPIVALAGYATRTKEILLGTNIAVLPFYPPVRMAEDTAMLDVISKGRFVFGAAIGYRPDEFVLHCVPMEGRGARFEEQIKLITALWTEENVVFEGKYYQLKDVNIEPKPIAVPRPPIWLGGWGPLSLRRAAELGDAWIPGPTAGLEKLINSKKGYLQALGAVGKSYPTEWPLTRELVIADTDEEANELAEKYLLINYRDEYGGGWEHPLIGKEDTSPVDKLELLGEHRFIIGNPDHCIQIIHHFVEILQTTHLILRLYFPGIPHKHIMHELELISQEVMPAFEKGE